MTPAIPAPRQPAVLSGIPVDPSDPIHGSATFGPLDTPAAVLVAETREEVTAAVTELTELTGDEPIGTTVNVGGIEFVKHSTNPFGSGAMSNPFAATPNGGAAPLSLDNPFRVAPPPAPKALLLPPHLVPGAPKAHQSVSSIQMISECALRYRLHYRDGIRDDSPAWWNVGGTAFHATVQHVEQMHAQHGQYPIDEPVFQTERDAAAIWREKFDETIAATESDTDTGSSTWRAAKGGKENSTWWRTAGEDMVRRYVQHRREFLRDWRLLTTPTGGLAQEVEFNANIDGVMMKGFIDSAWISADGTTIRVEDYKSGSSAGDEFQLKTYGAALRAMGADGEGTRRLVGTFYEARKGASTAALELTAADDAEVSYRANTAQQMDRAGLFPANPGRNGSNCSTCSVAHACPVMALKS